MTGELVPQVVERGGSTTVYRARKAPEAIVVRLCGFEEGILVLRCHDLDVAIDAVGQGIVDGVIPTDLADRLVVHAFDPETKRIRTASQVWVRYVPDHHEDPSAGGSWERELRGTLGATPAVLFACPHESPLGSQPTAGRTVPL